MWLINHLIVICITHSKYFAISDYCSSNPLTNSSQALGAYHICRHGSTSVSTVFRNQSDFSKYRRFIFLIKKILSKLQGFIRGEWNQPLSCLNDSETQERGLQVEAYLGCHQKHAPSVLVQEIGQDKLLSQINA